MITNSVDISNFDFAVLWDLSGAVPVVKITNQSSGDHLDNLITWFEVYSGGNLKFHTGLEATPDKTGVWSTMDVTEPIPQVLGHVEWSGNFFKVIGFVKDSEGKKFQLEKTTRICRPAGNTGQQANNFGVGSLEILTKCEKARLYVEDKSDYSYAGLSGTSISKLIRLHYPPDGTGAVPAPKEVADINNALLPISRNGDGYQIVLSAVYQYDFDNDTSVKIKYKFQKSFPIQCNIDLCPLICDIQRMEERFEQHGCSSDDREKLALINSKLNRAMMAKMQPLCGVDVGAIVDEIKALGGFECECTGNEYNGINPIVTEGDPLQCADIIACLNEQLNTLDPKCLAANQTEWEGMSLLAKMQKIITNSCCTGIDVINPGDDLCPVVTITPHATTLDVSWVPVPGQVRTIIYVFDNAEGTGGSVQSILVDSGTSTEITDLVAATNYWLRVLAVNEAGATLATQCDMNATTTTA